MNQRLSELYGKILSESENTCWNIEDAEQFGELVVRECAKQVNHLYKQGGGTYGETILSHFNIKVK